MSAPPSRSAVLSLHDALPILFAVERGGDYVADVIGIATLNSIVEEDPELIEKLVLGVVEGAQWVRQNPEEAGEILLSYRSEEHTSELQSRGHLVCRLLLEKQK